MKNSNFDLSTNSDLTSLYSGERSEKFFLRVREKKKVGTLGNSQ